MRALLIFMFGFFPAAAQSPLVRIVNLSRSAANDFTIGERFEIRITGAPRRPISVRTVRQGQTDWGPVIASTDSTGQWSTAGAFEKSDFGSWSQTWTVGGKLAAPAIQFSVKAPCLPGGRSFLGVSGPNQVLTCDTADRRDTFVTPSLSDPFRAPDGRLIPGRPAQQTPEQYHMEILTHVITSGDPGTARISFSSSKGALGDETAGLIDRLIGPNALTESETRNVLELIHAAFAKPETIAPDAREPLRTLAFLRHLAERTGQDALRQQIAGAIAYLQTR